MTHIDLPDHLADYARDVIAMLGIEAWRITINLVDEIDGTPAINGSCSYHEPYRIATIRLRRDIPLQRSPRVLYYRLDGGCLAARKRFVPRYLVAEGSTPSPSPDP